uniref:Retrovirus-related Pol polyprotein from transposon TNT 1-94-like beta-barrel domain-containing protein n=1 Tax=Cajanus cajan TaxID=3821 RepID=A0A151RPJ4_CAJCA|nr:hypothetical protein KK1_034036 [Cajanus cajan]
MKSKSTFNTFGFVSQGVCILDFGATDHMIPFFSLFASYSKTNTKQFITVANGNNVSIIGSNSIQLEHSIFLHNVLHVTKLANNLISIQKLTMNLNCLVTFFHSYCSFQELATGKTILIAKKQGGLYFLKQKGDGDKNMESTLSHHAKTDT